MDEQTVLLRAFLSNPNWRSMLHEEDCLHTEDDPDSCKCDGHMYEEMAHYLFPELTVKEFLY